VPGPDLQFAYLARLTLTIVQSNLVEYMGLRARASSLYVFVQLGENGVKTSGSKSINS